MYPLGKKTENVNTAHYQWSHVYLGGHLSEIGAKYAGLHGVSATVLCNIRILQLTTGSREVSQSRYLAWGLLNRFGIWQADEQCCCRTSCQISYQYDDRHMRSPGFETLPTWSLEHGSCVNSWICLKVSNRGSVMFQVFFSYWKISEVYILFPTNSTRWRNEAYLHVFNVTYGAWIGICWMAHLRGYEKYCDRCLDSVQNRLPCLQCNFIGIIGHFR